MREQLDGSYNIQTIIALEDDQANKLRMLRDLEFQDKEIQTVSKSQKKAICFLRQSSDYEKKFNDLNIELKQAKDHYRKLQVIERDDNNLMRSLHQQKIQLEEKHRSVNLQIKERKKMKLMMSMQKHDEDLKT